MPDFRTLLVTAQTQGALAMLLLFATVVLLTFGVSVLLRPNPGHRRLVRGRATVGQATLNEVERGSFWNGVMTRLERRVGLDKGERSKLRIKMMRAGFMSTNAGRNFYVARMVLGFSLPAMWLVSLPVLSREMQLEFVLLGAAVVAAVGLYAPALWLALRTSSYQNAITESFPDALDMMMVCVEAGLGLDAAFDRVGKQIARAHPELALQYGLVSLELRAGKGREEALRNLADRIGLEEIQSFTSLLIQSDRLGTSIAQTLRVYSDEMRAMRALRAEEKAHKLPVKLSIPLVIFILPSMFAVVMLPAVIIVIRVLIPALGAQPS